MSQTCNRCYKTVPRACQSDTEASECRHLKRQREDLAQERAANVSFMKTPAAWPRWPLLPLKKPARIALATPGFIIAGEKPHVVYKAVIFRLVGPTVADIKKEVPPEHRETFDSYEAIFDAGWRVD